MDQVTGLYRVDFESMVREWKSGVPNGQTSNIKALDEIFKWMPGSQNALYGWPNDGKGTFFDYLACVRCMFDKEDRRFLMMKQEDMSSTRYGNEKAKITANRVHRGLMWTYTGKCPDKNFVAKYGGVHLSDKDEMMAAMSWVDEHFFVMSPKDRSWKVVSKLIRQYCDEFGITDILIDPAKSVKDENDGRADVVLDDRFIEAKEIAIETNTTIHWIAHPKSNIDVRESKDKNAPYKIVNQWMVAGGAPWDNNMDAQYSVYRPFRHNNPNAPEVEFYNLKQRNSEEVLAQKGMVNNIKFDRLKRRYYFDGKCAISGETWTDVKFMKQTALDLFEPKKEVKPQDLPF